MSVVPMVIPGVGRGMIFLSGRSRAMPEAARTREAERAKCTACVSVATRTWQSMAAGAMQDRIG